jgi:serine kinase of HPr protein (carbohydrate metabolism regulator)
VHNFHASAVLVADRGVLVAGPSGSGKTALCLSLLDHARLNGFAARLVSDDQVLLVPAHGGRLIAAAPPPIAGLVELRGFGPAPLASEPRMVVDLLVRLVDPAAAPRLAEDRTAVLEGCPIPVLDLPARSAAAAARAVAGALRLPPFGL